MTASRFVFLATASAALIAALSGCVGPTSPVTAVSHRGTSDLIPWSDPDLAPGTIEGELRRGSVLPADEEGLDTTKPWPNVVVVILDSAGQQAAVPVSDAQGRFRVALAAGDYAVNPLWPQTQLHPLVVNPRGTSVTVVSDATVSLRLVCDPGIFQ